MKKYLLIVLFLFGLLTGCKKDGATGGGGTAIKYEITTTSPVVNDPTWNWVAYTNGKQDIDSSRFTSGTVWSKSLTVIPTNRPFYIELGAAPELTQEGSVTGNVYVDGQLKATQTNPTIGKFGAVSIFYTLN